MAFSSNKTNTGKRTRQLLIWHWIYFKKQQLPCNIFHIVVLFEDIARITQSLECKCNLPWRWNTILKTNPNPGECVDYFLDSGFVGQVEHHRCWKTRGKICQKLIQSATVYSVDARHGVVKQGSNHDIAYITYCCRKGFWDDYAALYVRDTRITIT